MVAVVGSALALLVVSSFFFNNGPTNVEGALTDKIVTGVVRDHQTDQPLAGAEVTVEIWGGSWPEQDFLRTTESTVTDLGGHYEVTIDANFWDPHNTIKVFANYGLAQGIHSVEADGESSQTVDVYTDAVIPEFSDSVGLLAVFVCMTCTVVLRARRRK